MEIWDRLDVEVVKNFLDFVLSNWMGYWPMRWRTLGGQAARQRGLISCISDHIFTTALWMRKIRLWEIKWLTESQLRIIQLRLEVQIWTHNPKSFATSHLLRNISCLPGSYNHWWSGVEVLKTCLQMAIKLDLDWQVYVAGHQSILWDLRGMGGHSWLEWSENTSPKSWLRKWVMKDRQKCNKF